MKDIIVLVTMDYYSAMKMGDKAGMRWGMRIVKSLSIA